MLGVGSWIFHALGLGCGVLVFSSGLRLLAADPFWPPIFPVPGAWALGARLLFVAGVFANYIPYLVFDAFCSPILPLPSVFLFLHRYVLMEAENAS